jgi:hypothetical protein
MWPYSTWRLITYTLVIVIYNYSGRALWCSNFTICDLGSKTSRNSPGFDPSILRHSGIWGAADEAVLIKVHQKTQKSPCYNFTFFIFQGIKKHPLPSCFCQGLRLKSFIFGKFFAPGSKNVHFGMNCKSTTKMCCELNRSWFKTENFLIGQKSQYIKHIGHILKYNRSYIWR